MNKILTIIFIFLLFLIAAQLGYLGYLNKQKTIKNQIQTKDKFINPTPTKTISEAPDPYIKIPGRVYEIEGKVISWENADDSFDDKYLNLKEDKTGKVIKTRIIFDKEAATSSSKLASGFGKRRKGEKTFTILGPIANYDFEEVKKITQDRTIVIMPAYPNAEAKTFYQDDFGVMIS